ncbi:MAG TPA: arylsulfatase [Armatimonadota bacterium]|nr:arylsulfatase [Armatimonadota bacterium]
MTDPKPKGNQPNILLLMSDQWRGDALGANGNDTVHTPHIDSLAADGVAFRAAYSSTPSCTPARAGLLTGLAPWHHGMLGYGNVNEHYTVELPQALRDAGYDTFGIGKMHWTPQRALHGFHGTLLDESGRVESPGFVSDYRQWFAQVSGGADPDATGIDWNGYEAKPYVHPESWHPTAWTGQTALDLIDRHTGDAPFFLKVSFARPHSPYEPPQRFWDLHDDASMPPPVIGSWAARHAAVDHPIPIDTWHGDLGLAQAKRSRRGYYGSIAFIDDQIGRLLQALRDRGIDDNTLILFTSDHGDMLGDHHLWRKTYPYEGSVRIPMVLRWPTSMGMDDRRGQTLDSPVELRDLLPTFLDAAGAPIPEFLDGSSILPLVRGDAKSWRPYIDLEHSCCYTDNDDWTALTDGEWKYIFHAGIDREQLFHLHADPDELDDLAPVPAHAQTLALWRARLADHLSERGEAYMRNGSIVAPRPAQLHSPFYHSGYPARA